MSASATEVIVKLARAADSTEHHLVRARAAELGISLEPLHPATSDPELASYLVAQVDLAALDRVIEQLLRCDGVEGAYAKPRGEAPEGSVEQHAR